VNTGCDWLKQLKTFHGCFCWNKSVSNCFETV